MDVTDNTHLVFAFFAVLSHGDMAGAQVLLADHTTWWMPGTLLTSGVYKQRGAILEECQDYASLEVCHAVGEGNHVAVEWVARGHSPQGPRYGNYYHLITGFAVRDGKIQAIRDHSDMLYAKEVLSH